MLLQEAESPGEIGIAVDLARAGRLPSMYQVLTESGSSSVQHRRSAARRVWEDASRCAMRRETGKPCSA